MQQSQGGGLRAALWDQLAVGLLWGSKQWICDHWIFPGLCSGSSSTGGLGGFHRMLFPSGGAVPSVLGSCLCRCLEAGRGGFLSSQHCSKAEKEPDISPGTSNGGGGCKEVIPV